MDEPDLFDMRYFKNEHTCKTTHCIGGWVEELSGLGVRKALDIDAIGYNRLCYVIYLSGSNNFGWPADLASEYLSLCHANTWRVQNRHQHKAAEIAAKRIDRFIESNGGE